MIPLPEFILPDSDQQARAIQESLRARLVLRNEFNAIDSIAGIDVGYDNERGLALSSIVLLSFPKLELLEQTRAEVPVDFPYIPGMLAFREIPALIAGLAKISRKADLLMVDGQGIAHPRRMGIAAHLGVLLDMPSIGVAKSRLTGIHEALGDNKEDTVPLMDKFTREQIGTVLRSKKKTNPLFISPGHRVDIHTALKLTLACLTNYRLPEPTRLADKFSKKQKIAA